MQRSVTRRSAGLAVTVVLAAAVGALGLAVPASAHVTVNPDEAVQGERARVDIRVPTESDTESTTKLEVHFPEEAPISSVSVGQMPGWSIEVGYRALDEPIEGGHGEQVTDVVEVITWTAEEGAGIPPGQFGEFPVSLGPLPEVDQLVLPALQTYSDGEIVRWIDEPEEGTEPESPAPVLTLAAAGAAEPADTAASDGGENGDTGATNEDSEAADSAAESGSDSDSGSGAGTWLGLAGLVAGLAGLALGGIAFTRTRTGQS